MHVFDHMQLGQAGVGQLPVPQMLGDDPVDPAARGQDRIRHNTHQADVPATEHQLNAISTEVIT